MKNLSVRLMDHKQHILKRTKSLFCYAMGTETKLHQVKIFYKLKNWLLTPYMRASKKKTDLLKLSRLNQKRVNLENQLNNRKFVAAHRIRKKLAANFQNSASFRKEICHNQEMKIRNKLLSIILFPLISP
jgi:hypothetical protein